MSDGTAETDQTTLRLDAPIDFSMGLLQRHTVASTPKLSQKSQCVVGCDALEIDDVRADVYVDLED